MILKPKPVSTRQCHYDTETRTYVGEISSTYGFGQVYDDACDEGLTLVSARTGREVVCAVTAVDKRDGEIVCWRLAPIARQESLDQHAHFTVRLFND